MQGKAREAALSAIERCRRNGAWSASSIDGAIKKYELDRRDAALASRICLGVLQNSSLLDFYLAQYCSTPMNRLEPKVLDILRAGAYQLVFMDKIPANAAVNESVSLCGSVGLKRAAGLVNAVLRRLAAEKDKLPDVPGIGTAEYLSIKYSHPLWLAKRIADEKGFDFAESFFAANNQPCGTGIQINTLKVSAEDYIRALSREDRSFSVNEALNTCINIDGGSVTELPGFEDGLFYVQDPAARLCAEIAGVEAGMRVLDACAAPGGKSFAAAIRMKNEGSITACDIHAKKLNLIASGAGRLGITVISTREMDAREKYEQFADAFDAVIADVPCSGIGVIRKKPEIRTKSEEELSGLPAIQRDILNNLSSYVKRGGVILYSTCTVLKEENEGVVTRFLKENTNFKAEDFEIGNIKSRDGMYTFWPNVDGTDGFFACKLRRME